MTGVEQSTSWFHEFNQRSSLARKWRGNLLFTFPFICFVLVQLVHHQMWRDELNAWGIAVASGNLIQLFHTIHYEAHPSLWYLLLWLASRFTASVVGLKVVQALVVIAIYLVIGLCSPFSKVEKSLLFLSYFLSFEYTVFSRMYGLVVLLVFVHCLLRTHRPQSTEAIAVVLGLLANADLLGVFLSGTLGLEYVLSQWDHLFGAKDARFRISVPLLVYGGLLCFSIWSMKPSPDISWRTTGHVFEHARDWLHLKQTIRYVWATIWWPLLPNFPTNYWNPHDNPFRWRFLIPAPVLLAVYFMIFRHRKVLMVVTGLTAIAAIAFNHLIYYGSTRHFGITFIAFVAAYWIQRYDIRRYSPFAVALLAINAVAGIAVAGAQWQHPFSNASAAADWIRAHGLHNATLVGTPDTSAAGVAEYLERPIYFLDCSCSGRFLLFSRRRDDYSVSQIPERMAKAVQDLHTNNLLLISAHPLPLELGKLQARGYRVRQAAEFVGAEAYEENFYLYTIQAPEKTG